MLEVPGFNMEGQRTGEMQIDPAVLGGRVRPKLLKQAMVQFLANRRRSGASTRSRGMVKGSTHKLYRQKGTGNARVGASRTCVRRGGGVAFAKGKENFHRDLPKKMRRLARNNAILAKITSGNAIIIDNIAFETPKTKRFAGMLNALGVEKSCLVATDGVQRDVWLSGRNLPKTDIRPVAGLHGYEVMRRQKLVFSKGAFEALQGDPVRLGASEDAGNQS